MLYKKRVVTNKCNCGWPLRDCLGCTTTKKLTDIMEALYRKNIIEDYTDDGWVLNKNNWYPLGLFMKSINKGDL